MILFFDTETTGLPLWNEPSEHPGQPHIVQFAGLLVDPLTAQEVGSVNLIVRPDGWEIPPEVSAIHGITNEISRACGVDERVVVDLFADLREQATVEVCHNLSFDRRIMRIAMLRHLGMTTEEIDKSLPGAFCTMNAASAVMKMAPTERMRAYGFTKPKPPKLIEAIKHFFDEDLLGAHDAMVDVRACARLYFHLQTLKVPA